jgi:hypothetical protein
MPAQQLAIEIKQRLLLGMTTFSSRTWNPKMSNINLRKIKVENVLVPLDKLQNDFILQIAHIQRIHGCSQIHDTLVSGKTSNMHVSISHVINTECN